MAHMELCDKHNMVAFLQNPSGSEDFHEIVDFLARSHIRYALTANPTIYASLVEQFWQIVTVETVNDEEQQINVTVDGHKFVITEASVRGNLQLADVDGISSLPNTDIFEQLTLMGPKKTSWEQFSSNIATAIICLATNRTFKFPQLIFDGVHVPLFETMLLHDQPGQGKGPTLTVESQHTPIASPSTSQPTTS
ncbi:hypothetical protein Tco_0784379 [Tanacetum coccineum]